MRFGLERMRRLMTALGSPQEAFRAIHVWVERQVVDRAHDRRAAAGARPCDRRIPVAALVSFAERVEVGGRPVASERSRRRSRAAAQAAALVDRTLDPGDRVTQFEALTAAAYWELAARRSRGRRGRGRPRRPLRRDQRDRLRAGADEREPRAHALAGPDGAPHRRGEARGRADRWHRWSPAAARPARRCAVASSGVVAERGATAAAGGRRTSPSSRRSLRRLRCAARGLPARQLRGRGGGGGGLPRARSTPRAVRAAALDLRRPDGSRWWPASRSRSWTARTTRRGARALAARSRRRSRAAARSR